MGLYTSGKAAKEVGINIETLRFYEKKKLMPKPKRSPSGYRLYDSSDIKRLNFIKHAKSLGFTLNEIKELLFLRVDEKTTCGDLRDMALIKIEEIKNKINEMKKIKSALESLASQCHGEVPKSECPILEILEE